MTGFSALAVAEDADDREVRWVGVSRILGPRWLQLPLLTIGLLGVQVLWSVEMSQASPYLIRLGLSKSLTAIAFLAGPLSGLLVQPLIGVIADNSKSRFGRRRPYMLLASVVCAVSTLLLGFTRELVSIFTSRGSAVNDSLTIVFAVIALYGLDFSVNAVQAVDRALIVDSIPTSKQPAGNAWAARMLGLGSVLGFFIGNVDLTKVFPIFGRTELQVLSVIASFLLLLTQSTTAACVKERVLVSSSCVPNIYKAQKSLREEIREIWDNLLNLPRVIRQICIIQFLAWFAWFPVLFYTVVYVGDLYKKGLPIAANAEEVEAQDKEASIIGSRALFHHGLVALAANFVLPLFVKSDYDSTTSTPLTRKPSLLDRLKIVHLCELWAFSHLLFAVCMGGTFFVSTVGGASFLITIVGFSWAITQWVPFSLLAEEILASSQSDSFDDNGSISIQLLDRRLSMEPMSGEPDEEPDERQGLMEDLRHKHQAEQRVSQEGANDMSPSPAESRASSIDGVRTRLSSEMNANGRERASRKRSGGLQAKSGIIIGIHNLFIVVPQFISTAFTSLIFALFDPAKSVPPGPDPGLGIPGNGTFPNAVRNDTVDASATMFYPRQEMGEAAARGANSVAVIFRVGGIAATLAFILSWRLARELKKRQ
ncbi:MFS general substrate transporter [Fomitiporia mediterranea MF3/22]|uniref:MFS general substrate transporter n=1 Tax=Fomitiporia mediterranea (strain MF3/22) TaxID=694068 RepID=UPI0004407CEB|nr:MFS general substrate transporter [Fomitiporia mediterranea MF3/22]EJD02015.1 MFS general substrate transporter [Fomitiporia mediterranea MF3/22]